ncbi:MAG: hypothetical protein ACE5PM_01115 [Candidatus Hydrothermarchaeales archaeon]
MYHPGKVLKIFSSQDEDIEAANDETQAMLMMWDRNLLTLLVDLNLAAKVKEGDIVLVDYRPLSDRGPPAPKMIVTKVLRGEIAERTWREYKAYYKKKKEELGPGAPIPAPQSYIG